VRTPAARRAAQAFAWLGGAAFLASLAYFVYFYSQTVERWTGAPPHVSVRAVVIDVALFTVFGLHHSVLARRRVRAEVARLVSPELERSVYVWIASALFVLVCRLWQPIGGTPGVLWELPAAWVGHVVRGAGIALIVLAARSIDPLELAGIRQTFAGGAERGAGITHRFPYNLVRHPIYLGWVLATFGTTPMTGDRLLFASVSAAYLVAAVPWEERSLQAAFGDEYGRYRRRVRWRIIPGVY
jgi:methanethiol S-methyltransferase